VKFCLEGLCKSGATGQLNTDGKSGKPFTDPIPCIPGYEALGFFMCGQPGQRLFFGTPAI